jgi:P pilus assembly chaperone PapD
VLTVRLASSGGLEIANDGSQHMRIDRWRLRDSAGTVMAGDTGPGYLLPGASQVLPVTGNRFVGPAMFEADSEARTLKIAVGL